MEGSEPVKEEKCLFIFISNTYADTRNELPGVRIDRQNILASLPIELSYNEVFKPHFINLKTDYPNFNILFITNCNKLKTLFYLNQTKKKYNIYSVVLCLSGHGSNDTGLVNFISNVNEEINLSEMIQAISDPYLVNITVFLDMCRSDGINLPFNDFKFTQSITNKRVAVVTAGPRTLKVGGGIDGGKLITALCDALNSKKDKYFIYECLLSMEKMLILIGYVSALKIEQNIDTKVWERLINKQSKTEKDIEIYNNTCNKLPSLYFNNEVRQIIVTRGLLDLFSRLFKNLCKYYKDSQLSIAVKRTTRTIPRPLLPESGRPKPRLSNRPKPKESDRPKPKLSSSGRPKPKLSGSSKGGGKHKKKVSRKSRHSRSNKKSRKRRRSAKRSRKTRRSSKNTKSKRKSRRSRKRS